MNIVKRFIAWLTGRNNKEHCMNERTISTINELFAVINEYSDKGFYFRGENKDYGETACLPSKMRNSPGSVRDAIENELYEQKFEELGIGFPYDPPAGSSTQQIILNALTSTYYWSFFKRNEEKLTALMEHYTPDFVALDKSTGRTNTRTLYSSSAYLNITTDIMFALHIACSEAYFLLEGEDIKSLQSENSNKGCLYVFDLKRIEKSKLLKLVSYPNYSYFCKEKTGDKTYFQPFDRITHQRGAFLAPQRNKAGEINYDILRGEIKKYIHAKITIKSDVKKQLYEIFGKEQGLEYYFPKIPCVLPTGDKKIQQAYKKLKLIALLEKKE